MKDSPYNDDYKLISSIRKLSLNSPSIISIDGVDGVGKSTLSCKLAEELSIPNIEIDTFLQEQQDGYIKYIDSLLSG